jgi:acid phosphatase (class B)
MRTTRGDTIYFITGRTQSTGERPTEAIKWEFSMQKINPVVFTAGGSKNTAFLKNKGVKISRKSVD